MRRLALVPLLAATSCNWVFGLEPTVAIDAAPPSELPPGPRTRLVWAIATTDGVTASGIDPVLEYRAIGSEALYPAPPTIQVGDDTGLSDAPYDLTDGSFEIPYRLRESPHRIVYTLPGESVPHEVQWALTGAILVVPRTTRADAPVPPASSGYTITPMGLTTGLDLPIAFTSGVFSTFQAFEPNDASTSAITIRYAGGAKPLAGPLGAPQGSKGDWVLVTEWLPRGPQTSVDGWAVAKQLDLAAGTMTIPGTQPMWETTERTLSTGNPNCPTGPGCLPSGGGASAGSRLMNVLGSLGGTPSVALAYGVSPSTELAGFIPGTANTTPPFLDQPLMLKFLESNQLDVSITLADPTPALDLEPILFARVATARTVGSVTLTSAVQALTNVFHGTIPYGAPLASNVKLGDISLSANATDGVPVSATSSPISLTFQTEAGYDADDFVITLYEITDTSLAPVRVYHVIQPVVKIDGTLLVSGHSYVFGITSRTGLGGADRGDYQKAQYPFGSSTTFPRTFVVQ